MDGVLIWLDGIRVDVPNMLYLDYDEGPKWMPNKHFVTVISKGYGFLLKTSIVRLKTPFRCHDGCGITTVANTTTQPIEEGGLGFRLQMEYGLDERYPRPTKKIRLSSVRFHLMTFSFMYY